MGVQVVAHKHTWLFERVKSAGIVLEERVGQKEPGCASLTLCLLYAAPGACLELGCGFTLGRAGWSLLHWRWPTGKHCGQLRVQRLSLPPYLLFFWGGCNIPGRAVVVFAPSWWLGACLLLRCRGTSCIWRGGLGGTRCPRLCLVCGGWGTPRGDIAESEKEGPKPRTPLESSDSSSRIIFMALWIKK